MNFAKLMFFQIENAFPDDTSENSDYDDDFNYEFIETDEDYEYSGNTTSDSDLNQENSESECDADNHYDNESKNNQEFENNQEYEYDSDESYEDQNLETNPGYLHIQARISTIKKTRLKQLVNDLWNANNIFCRAHIRPTSNPAYLKGNSFYCLKAQTRVSGPYTDKDEPEIKKPYQVKIIEESGLYPWQQYIKDKLLYNYANGNDCRKILYIILKTGAEGKTSLAQLLYCEKIAHIIPPLDNILDISQAVMNLPEDRHGYIIDMPRSLETSYGSNQTHKKNQRSLFFRNRADTPGWANL